MSLLKIYDDTISGPWETAGIDVQYRIKDGVLTFQQTVSKSDWLFNFQFWITPYKDMPRKWYAHRGFVALYKSVRDILRPQYKAITEVRGFSQGAALAQLAVEDYFFHVGKPVEAYCFGCPHPFAYIPPKLKPYFSGAFSRTSVYNTRGDIVSMVPPWYTSYGKKVILQVGKVYPNTKSHYTTMYVDGLHHLEE